jgi:L-fuculose-phosphate aldolase
MLVQERERLVAAARRLAQEGLVVGSAGNLSLRAGERIAVTATGAACGRLTPEEVLVVDVNGRLLEGDGRPTSELELHLGIYRRFGSQAVVHTHPPFATALSCVIKALPSIHYHMQALGGAIRVAPYARFGTAELAELTLEALEGRAAALMESHGCVTHAGDLDQAVEHALLLEWACGVYWRAVAVGTPKELVF